jgi:cytochrome c-type biogenesis protein CcmE
VKRTKFLVGGLVIAVALGYLIYAGVTQSAVYFVTPSELQGAPVAGKAYRLGGLVAPGSVHWKPRSLDLRFTLTDGKSTIAVRHAGSPPDLFGEGRGAVVEGRWAPEGYFKATMIMAKHSEDYTAPTGDSDAGYRELLKTLGKPGA